ncbi:MAG: hypothetical protein SGJ23_08480 [Alphaproteobacteria bacterium]|nr:hypothetical protein [Alphaproteobacteria bacterium]
MREAFIHGCGDYYAAVETDDALVDLKPLVKEATGQPVRRVGRFIQLALIGAGRCLGGRKAPEDTAVYFTSGRGDMEVTVEVMEALFRDGEAPKPLHFINTVSNAACFYISKHFGLHGRSTFLCNRYFSFETTLQLALFDLASGAVKHALVGSVDIVTPPLSVQRRRLHLPPDTPVAEASHWLLLSADPNGARGAITAAAVFGDRAAALGLARAGSATAGATGQFGDGAAFLHDAGLPETFDYRAGRAHYDSQSGAVISAFLDKGSGALVHVNADPDGRYGVMLVRTAPP